ncbi:glycosyl hydrolase 108 family protein, partial [Klebsiella pneumoniae]
MTADQIIEGILGKEGGYVDHPSDKGGPTRWGITQTTARAHGYTGDMRNLPRETAKQILLSDYWTGPRFDQVAALSTLLADERKRAARTVLTGMCYSVGSATRQGSSS